MNSHRLTKHVVLFSLMILYYSSATAQPWGPGINDIDFTQVTAIDKKSSALGATVSTNINGFWPEDYSAVNRDGTVLVRSEKLIRLTKEGNQISDLPKNGQNLSGYRFSPFRERLFYWDMVDYYNRTWIEYDLTQDKIVNSLPLQTMGRYTSFLESSDDGSTLVALLDACCWNIFHFFNGEYRKTESQSYRFNHYLFMNAGERIFWYFQKDLSHPTEETYMYIEKSVNGWSYPMEVPGLANVNILDASNPEPQWIPIAFANEGKTLVLRSVQNTLAQIHEDNGEWSQPEPVGAFQLPYMDVWGLFRNYFYIETPVHCSHDGRVVALEQLKDFWLLRETSTYNLVQKSIDVIVYIKDEQGRWSKHQVNQPGVKVAPNGGVMLSGDGSKVFWVPLRASCVSGFENYR